MPMATSLALSMGLVFPVVSARAQNSPPFTGYAPVSSSTQSSPAAPAATQSAPALRISRDSSTAPANGAQKGGKDAQAKDMVPSAKQGFETLEFRNLREVPGPEVLFRLESQEALFERMKQETLRAGEPRIIFPDEPPITTEPYQGRHWLALTKEVEPYFVVHGRLLFEQQNTTRGIWGFGPLTPMVCMGKFYWDAALLPYNAGTRLCQQYDTDAGKCLPGDPSPLFLYPVEFSLTGLIAEGAAITGAFFIFP
jgi:hypothetical protein